jgi:signal transduction histidine kinase
MTDAVRLRLKIGGGLFAYFTVEGLLQFGYQYLDELARAEQTPFLDPLIEELTGSYGSAVVFATLIFLTSRFRLRRENWVRRVPVYLCWTVLGSVVHTTLNALGRQVLFPLAGLGRYDYGIMVLRFPMEFLNDILWFWTYVALLHLAFHYREARDREVRTAQLEGELARAQLSNLRAQLQPHFLFNTLNTISSRMYEDLRGADRMMAQLGDLLRTTLESSTTPEVPVFEELKVLRLYLEIMQSRFEERLEVKIEQEAGCERALVPSMILQPLAENAIRHGILKQSRPGRIDVLVRKEGETLQLQVCDNGPGLSSDTEDVWAKGLGLKNTVERLSRLYGSAQSFKLTQRDGGGLSVSITIPFRLSHGNDGE